MRDQCLSGPECGLCFTRTNPLPLGPSLWRYTFGPLSPTEGRTDDEDAIGRIVTEVKPAPVTLDTRHGEPVRTYRTRGNYRPPWGGE